MQRHSRDIQHDNLCPNKMVLCVFFFAIMYPRSCYLSSTTECNDMILYVPGTQLTLGLIGVWAFFWKVEPPQTENIGRRVYMLYQSLNPSRFIDPLAHLHVSLRISANLGDGQRIHKWYERDGDGCGILGHLQVGWRMLWKTKLTCQNKYQCSCDYILPIWENSLTTSVFENI